MSGIIGIIGGSGLTRMESLQIEEERWVDTPFGPPSSPLRFGQLAGTRVVFLARHGDGHFIPPSRVNYRANIFALKSVGVDRILALSAVGSLREEIRPRDFVIVDQAVDRTRLRANSFFDEALAVHVSVADPYCPRLRESLSSACRQLDIPVHDRGCYICIEGPQFSTRAESKLYRSWGMDVIGMTNVPECKLAREAEICFATVALATDYDVWHTTEDVSVDGVMANMAANVGNVQRLLQQILSRLPDTSDCACQRALAGAIMTAADRIAPERRAALAPLTGKYLTP